jgi:hypothetical protein
MLSARNPDGVSAYFGKSLALAYIASNGNLLSAIHVSHVSLVDGVLRNQMGMGFRLFSKEVR